MNSKYLISVFQKIKHCMRLSWFVKRHPKSTPSDPNPGTSITSSSTNTAIKVAPSMIKELKENMFKIG